MLPRRLQSIEFPKEELREKAKFINFSALETTLLKDGNWQFIIPILFFIFLAAPWGFPDLSSLTGDWTQAMAVKALSPNPGPPGNSASVPVSYKEMMLESLLKNLKLPPI